MKLSQIIAEVRLEYKTKYGYDPTTFDEENLQESYIMLSELLNPNNAYDYKTIGNGMWQYEDMFANQLFVRLVYQPVKDGHFEFKTWWIDEDGNKVYNEVPQGSSTKDWDKRTDTVAKIFRDEALPKFKQNNTTDKLVFLPVTKSRYLFSMRMIKKFIPTGWEIIEDFPKSITIVKDGNNTE